MWSEGRYDYERVPRERLPPRIHGDGDYHRIVNVVPKKPPLLERPGDGNYSRYDDYSHAEYRDYEDGRSFAHERRSGPPHRGDESGYRWTRDDHPTSRHPEYSLFKCLTALSVKKFFFVSNLNLPWCNLRPFPPVLLLFAWEKRPIPILLQPPVIRARRFMSDLSKFHCNFSKPVSIFPMYIFNFTVFFSPLIVGKERTLRTSRDASPSGSTAVPSSKALEKSNRLSEKELAEAASKWAAEKSEKAEESNLPEITEYD
ncbi:PPHLN protein, partial [Furnarius figulus]|nr:PPHLN protein [Furnarius figulus]